MKNSETRKIDIGKVIYSTDDKKEKKRYFINIASFGLSGAVDQAIEKLGMPKFLGGKLLWLYKLIWSNSWQPDINKRTVDKKNKFVICIFKVKT